MLPHEGYLLINLLKEIPQDYNLLQVIQMPVFILLILLRTGMADMNSVAIYFYMKINFYFHKI